MGYRVRGCGVRVYSEEVQGDGTRDRLGGEGVRRGSAVKGQLAGGTEAALVRIGTWGPWGPCDWPRVGGPKWWAQLSGSTDRVTPNTPIRGLEAVG